LWNRDGVVEAGAAPSRAGTWLLGTAAVSLGENGEKSEAGSCEFRDKGAEGFAESGEFGGEFLGEGSGDGSEEEGELEARLVGGGEEFELVWDMVGITEPDSGLLVEKREEGFGSAPEDWCGDGTLADGEKGDT
jgi:hypothetical protein